MAAAEGLTASAEERVLGPPIASLVRAGLIVPGLGRHGDQSSDTLLGYARTLPEAELAALHACPWCTQSLIQGLDAASKQVLMRLCTITSPVSEALISAWFVGEQPAAAAQALNELGALKMVVRASRPMKALMPTGTTEMVADAVKATPMVRQRVQDILSAPQHRPWAAAALDPCVLPSLPDPGDVPDASEASAAIAAVREAARDAASGLPRAEIEATAARKWHSVLSFLVGEPGAAAPPPDVLSFLLVSGLLVPAARSGEAAFLAQVEEADKAAEGRPGAAARGGADDAEDDDALGARMDPYALTRALRSGRLCLAPRGYRFLLADTERQLWTIIRHYASSRRARAGHGAAASSSSSSSSSSAPSAPAASPGTVVRLLMRLGHCRPGEAVPLAVLDPAETTVLRDLVSLGVVVVDGPADAADRASQAAAELAAALSEGVEDSSAGVSAAMARRAAASEASRIESLCSEAAEAAGPGPDRFFVSSLAAVLLSASVGEGTGAEAAARAAREDTAEAVAAGSSGRARSRFRLTAQGWSGGLESRAVSLSRAEARERAGAAATAAAASGLGALAARPSEVRLQVYVERNFRLYAITQESVHARLLAVFAKVEFRLPNMVVCRLTRASVGRALDLGINAATMRDFLERHAHPRAAAAGMAVPDNVKDQIYLWEMERKRLVVTQAVELSNFKSDAEWETVQTFLNGQGAMLAVNAESRQLWFRQDAMHQLNNHIVEWRAANPELA